MAAAQCESCIRWGWRGGAVLTPVEGCTWLGDEDVEGLSAPVGALVLALVRVAAQEGCCPGHLMHDAESMPDAYRAADLPYSARANQDLKAQPPMRS